MSDFNSKHDEFARRLDERAKKHRQPEMVEELPPDLQDRLQAWEARLDQRLAEFRGEVAALPEPPALVAPPKPQPSPARPAGILEGWLAELDALFHAELGLGRYSIPVGLAGPPLLLPDEAAMRQAAGRAGLALPVITPPVLHLPGNGTLVNQAQFPIRGNDQLKRAKFMAVVARERWGWGYLLEYTCLGQSAVQAGLYPALAARRLGLQSSGWTLLATGLQDWVEQFVLFKARHAAAQGVKTGAMRHPRPDRLVELVLRVIKLFPLYILAGGVQKRLLSLIDLVRFIFLEENDIAIQGLHQLLLQTGNLCRAGDSKLQELSGYSLSQVLSMFYFTRLESCVGIRAVPYAVLIAAYLPGLDLGQDAAQINQAIAAAPRQHPDTRLALLSGLDSRVKYDPTAMYTAAWERLKLDGPKEYFG